MVLVRSYQRGHLPSLVVDKEAADLTRPVLSHDCAGGFSVL